MDTKAERAAKEDLSFPFSRCTAVMSPLILEPGYDGYSGFFYVSILNIPTSETVFNSNITPEHYTEFIPEWFRDIAGIVCVSFDASRSLYKFQVEPVFIYQRSLYHQLWKFVFHKLFNLGMTVVGDGPEKEVTYGVQTQRIPRTEAT